MVRRQQLLRTGGLLAIAAAGGVVALLGAAAADKLGARTTVQQITAYPPPAPGGIGAGLSSPSGSLSIEQIYKRSAPGVVQITATSVRTQADPSGFLPPSAQTKRVLGSGFVISKAGHVVTSDHVIAGAQQVLVSFSGNDAIQAKVIGRDPSTDVAVLQIDSLSRSLTPLEFGDSDRVRVGDSVVAIGNPFSLSRTVTAGIVSAVQRTIDAPNGLSIGHAIQTDAAINEGNSGGPLINVRGQVIGVNAQLSTGGGQGNVGIGFAIPINTVKTVVAQLLRTGKVQHAFLGIGAEPINKQLAALFNLPTRRGLLVQEVTAGSAAAKAGLRAGLTPVIVGGESYQLGGDIIVTADGVPVASEEQLRDVISRKEPGDRLSLELYRGGTKRTIRVTLGNPPA